MKSITTRTEREAAITAREAAAARLAATSDEGLLATFAALTHQIHVTASAEGAAVVRAQRDLVQAEVLRRMGERG